MTILLDIDGVMVTTPSWKPSEFLEDGFLKFNDQAAKNLSMLLVDTGASIILATTHRINYSESEWKILLANRGIHTANVSKINECNSIQTMLDRGTEIKQWVDKNGDKEKYVIIDDDSSIDKLSLEIKAKWVKTKSLIGFDNEALANARLILSGT